jgi:hypothetical protein
VDAAEWKLELERVAPRLKVASAADAKVANPPDCVHKYSTPHNLAFNA